MRLNIFVRISFSIRTFKATNLKRGESEKWNREESSRDILKVSFEFQQFFFRRNLSQRFGDASAIYRPIYSFISVTISVIWQSL